VLANFVALNPAGLAFGSQSKAKRFVLPRVFWKSSWHHPGKQKSHARLNAKVLMASIRPTTPAFFSFHDDPFRINYWLKWVERYWYDGQ
jgi:hypothetical protein